MKNKQLFIMALLVVFGGMTFFSQAGFSDRDPLPGAVPGPDLTGFERFGDGRYTLLFEQCEKDYTSDCARINAMLIAAVKHIEKSHEMESLEADLEYSKNDYVKDRIAALLTKKGIDHPYYGKSYNDSLSQDEREDNDKAVDNELAKLPIGKVREQAQWIADALNY